MINGNNTISDWDNGNENYEPLPDMAVLYIFLGELKNSEPLPREQNSDPIGNSRNNEEYTELTLHLDDGSRIRLTLLTDESIHYGFIVMYDDMKQDVFATMWSLFSITILWNTRMRFTLSGRKCTS